MADQPEYGVMSDTPSPMFVSQDLLPERAAPVKTTGFIGFLRTRLFNSPTNILITIVSALLLWFILVPALKFALVDAVWTGADRTACLPKNPGDVVGACWPFIQAKLPQFIYGFYPEPERWRVNLTFFLASILLVPLLIPRLPGKSPNAILFFLAFPVIAFFLLRGGGLGGFGVSWTAGLLSGFNDSIGDGGRKLVASGETTAVIGPLLWVLGKLIVVLSTLIGWVLLPLTWLRDQIQGYGRPVWADLVTTAAIVSAVLFWLGGGTRAGWRPLVTCLAIFAAIGVVIAAMGLDRGGLPEVDSRLWGGLLVTLVVAVTGIVASMPVGIALALGRQSSIPLIRIFSIAFIEFWRGVPLITVLFFATYMLPLIVMPQALRHVIPNLVNSFISLFKDTSLVSIVALFDLLGQLRASFSDPVWSTPTTLFTGFAFTGLIYFTFCFGMSRYSLFVENRLNAHRRN